MTRSAWVLAVALVAVPGSGALACHGSSVVLDDKFNSPDPGWPGASEYVSFGASGVVLKPGPGLGYLVLNKNYTTDGTDLCATAVWAATGIKSSELDGTVGIVFWAKDYSNFYVAKISNQGDYWLTRFIADNVQNILVGPEGQDNHLDFVNKAPSDKNELELQISGTKGTFFVNGKKVFDFAGQPPPASGSLGLWAGNYTGDDRKADLAYAFPNFRISTYP
jgi:hypothetical protein